MSIVQSIILPATYRDSVFLMKLSCESARLSNAKQVSAMMATKRNKELLARSGLLTKEIEQAGSDDLAIAFEADSETIERVYATVQSFLNQPGTLADDRNDTMEHLHASFEDCLSIEDSLSMYPESKLALISVAGDYARYEAARALGAGLDIMLYSDNISLQDELALKTMAMKKGLILMGPDCGTAIIDGMALGFTNSVRSGTIGIIGSSGTGIQEISCLLDRCGLGIRCAYGTGGRDLVDEIGGLTAITALQRIAKDDKTQIIAFIGKTPGIETRKKLIQAYKDTKKKVIVRYLGVADTSLEEQYGISCASSLAELAAMVAQHLAPVLDISALNQPKLPPPDATLLQGMHAHSKYIRGIFSGGTFCREATEIAIAQLHDGKQIFVNTDVPGASTMSGLKPCAEHSFFDMGANEFTIGRPHPFVYPELKMHRIIEALCDEETAVLLTDIVLGYCVSSNQTTLLLHAIDKAAKISMGMSRNVIIVSSVCGTEQDALSRSSQLAILQDAGIKVLGNSTMAAQYAVSIIQAMQKHTR